MSEHAERFVILAAPRSGSNMLCTMFNSHPDVLCHHEIFNPRGIFYALELRNSEFNLGSMAERDRRPLAFLERLWKQPLGHSQIGFKMTHWQNPEALDALLGDPDIKKIVLRRNNRIKTHVSRVIAEHRDIWEDYSNDDEPGLPINRITLDLDELYKDIDLNNRYYEEICSRITAAGQTYCFLEYEALTSAASQQKALRFLGLDNHPLQVTSRKQNPDDLQLLVKNFDQIAMQLDDARLAKELRA